MSCVNCWAYKWDGEDYCLIIGFNINDKDIEHIDPNNCEHMLKYKTTERCKENA